MGIFNKGQERLENEDRSAEVSAAPKKEKTKKRSLKKWLRELKSELKKVVWPTKSQVVNNTWVVLVCIVVVGVALWIFDYVAGNVVQFLIKIVS